MTELADNFLYALRSGDYKQGKATYYNKETDCYCVFGVWFDTLGFKRSEFNSYRSVNITDAFDKFESVFPGTRVGQVMRFNDQRDEPWSFEQIADFLEPYKKA